MCIIIFSSSLHCRSYLIIYKFFLSTFSLTTIDNVYLPPSPQSYGTPSSTLSNSLQVPRSFHIRDVIHNFPPPSKRNSFWFLSSYKTRVILSHYFISQLSVETACRLIRIYVIHSAGFPHAR